VASSSSFASVWRQLQVLPFLARLPAFNDKLVRFDVILLRCTSRSTVFKWLELRLIRDESTS